MLSRVSGSSSPSERFLILTFASIARTSGFRKDPASIAGAKSAGEGIRSLRGAMGAGVGATEGACGTGLAGSRTGDMRVLGGGLNKIC